jgi:hypothetical protein
MCEEQGVFVGDMQLEHINSFEEFKQWKSRKPIRILSVEHFTYFGYMVLPISLNYITFNKGVLPGNNTIERIPKEYSNRFFKFVNKDILNKKFEYRVIQTIPKKSFEKLFFAASNEEDFSFVRYSFDVNDSDLWDREINIGKKGFVDAKEYSKIKANNALEESKRWVAEQFDKTYEPKFKEYQKDDFRGMLLQFRTIPDFKKRKKTNVCGY